MKARIIVESTILDQAGRLQKLRDTLQQIRDWNMHPQEYGTTNQVAFYRDLAQAALDATSRTSRKRRR